MADAIKAIHPFYDRIGTRHAKLLVRKAATWFTEMLGGDGDLEAHYKKMLDEGFDARTIQAFADRCLEGIDSRERQARMTDTFE